MSGHAAPNLSGLPAAIHFRHGQDPTLQIIRRDRQSEMKRRGKRFLGTRFPTVNCFDFQRLGKFVSLGESWNDNVRF